LLKKLKLKPNKKLKKVLQKPTKAKNDFTILKKTYNIME
jgi:hypothetical protein